MPGESPSMDKPTSSSASTRDEQPHSSSSPQQGDKPEDEASNEANGGAGSTRFECNICLDVAKDAVVSMCGHLFCWPCIHQWLETRPHRQLCPVCKSAISRDKMIPLYGRGGNETDPREKVPPRPAGQRTEAPQYNGFPGFHWGGGDGGAGGGVQFSFGIGTFPITMFASAFNFGFGDRRPERPAPGTRQHDEEQMLSNIFMWIGIAFIFFLLLA